MTDVRELRRLFARERIVERGRAAARIAGRRAFTVIRSLPAGEARAELEQITRDLTP